MKHLMISDINIEYLPNANKFKVTITHGDLSIVIGKSLDRYDLDIIILHLENMIKKIKDYKE